MKIWNIRISFEPILSSDTKALLKVLPKFPIRSFPTYRGLYIYLYSYTSAVNKTVNYSGDLPRGHATDDKSDCSNGISIRGRLYVYSMYTLWGLLDVLSSYLVHEQLVREGWKGLGVGRIHPPQIDWNCSWLISRSWWFVAASDRQ